MLNRKKQLVLKRQAEILKAIAHPLRIAIIEFLKDGQQCVCDIAKYSGSERSNVSRHLSVMVNAGILESRKEGLNVIYKLKTSCVIEFLSCIKKCLREQAKENQKLLSAL